MRAPWPCSAQGRRSTADSLQEERHSALIAQLRADAVRLQRALADASATADGLRRSHETQQAALEARLQRAADEAVAQEELVDRLRSALRRRSSRPRIIPTHAQRLIPAPSDRCPPHPVRILPRRTVEDRRTLR